MLKLTIVGMGLSMIILAGFLFTIASAKLANARSVVPREFLDQPTQEREIILSEIGQDIVNAAKNRPMDLPFH